MDTSPRPTVMIVIDEVDLAQAYSRHMEELDLDSQVIAGPLAMDWFIQERPAAILLDLESADTSARDLLHIIRNTPALANIPVILLAPLTDEIHRQRAHVLGATALHVRAHATVPSVAKAVQVHIIKATKQKKRNL